MVVGWASRYLVTAATRCEVFQIGTRSCHNLRRSERAAEHIGLELGQTVVVAAGLGDAATLEIGNRPIQDRLGTSFIARLRLDDDGESKENGGDYLA